MLLRIAFLLLFSDLALSVQAASLFDYGAPWRYHLGTAEASSPDSRAWRTLAFVDLDWSGGPTPIGYANPPNNPTEDNIATSIPTTQEGGYVSVFFRKPFVIGNPARVNQLTLNLNVDDGFIAWINGVEIGRYNVPDGALAFDATAVSPIEATLTPLTLTDNLATLLSSGTNLLAIQVFNANTSSSDLLLDAALASDQDETPPVTVDITPQPGSRLPQLTTLEVVFNESVTGVDAEDLLINGIPATQMTQISPLDYTFSFAQPAVGSVTVAWKTGHGIQDLAALPNPFAGGSWAYVLDTKVPPAAVVISEFLSDNQTGIRDEDSTRSDWIELYNMGTDPAILTGWFLSDSAAAPTRWRLPAVTLNAKGYLLIWASGKNRTNSTAPLHTNFKLGKSGGYLGLADPSGHVVSEFAPGYPAQQSDISYGRDPADASVVGFYTAPTPRAKNSTRGNGFAPEPVFSVAGGVFTNSTLSVGLTSSAGQIRYTVDGSLPTASSPLYSAALVLSTTTTVKARVFQTGLLPSAILARNYVLVHSSVASFTSNLPLMIFSTTGVPVADHVPTGQARTFASLMAVDTHQGRSSPLAEPEYFGQCEIGVRGQTSAGFPKRPYRMELQDAYRIDESAGLFGLPADSDWVLYNPYSDKPFLQNFLAYELFEKMGHYSVRRRFVEVFLNQSGGKISYPQDYAGIYILEEKIKVSGHRVELAKLAPADSVEPNISGGYMFKKDKSSAGDLDFFTAGGAGFSGQNLKLHEPQPSEITPAQLAWLGNYLNRMETALYAPNWLTATGTNHYSNYLDADSFVDYHWIVEFTKQIDGYRLSNYLQKDRNGKVKMEPIWDWNLSFGNADYLDGSVTSGWYYSLLGDSDHIWLRRLISGSTAAGGSTGDPDFNQKIADRWSQLRTNVLASSNVLARIDQLSSMLAEAADRDFARWPRLGSYVWPNPPIYSSPTTYRGIINSMKSWVSGRYSWIDSQFLKPPVLSAPGGLVPVDYKLKLSASTGSLYFTLDGSDPRLPGGSLSPKAIVYPTAGITLSNTVKLFTRARSGARWSGPTVATYATELPHLLISEIQYHPEAAPTGSPFSTEDFEFLEFQNSGPSSLTLDGSVVSEGIDFLFPPFTLTAGERVLLVKNQAAFGSRYGVTSRIAGVYTGSLGNSGEHLIVKGPLGELWIDFSYQSDWYPVTDGAGFSLVLSSDRIAPEKLGDPASWRPSAKPGGSPGTADSQPAQFPPIVISEWVSHSGILGFDQIELQNLSQDLVNIGGWFLSDDAQTPRKYRISDNTLIQPGGFLLFDETQFGNRALQPFAFDALGEAVYLFSGDGQTNLTGYQHGFTFGAQQAGTSFGRYLDRAGREQFVMQNAKTLQHTNSGPWISPVVFSEIMYHPADLNTNAGVLFAADGEYLEIFNRSATSVPLYDPRAPTNTWKLDGAVHYSFPGGSSIPARGLLVVVSFNPLARPIQLEAFKAQYGLSGLTVVGPYSGSLGNKGEKVSLKFPDVAITNTFGEITVPYVVAEEVSYQDNSGWPSGADGFGYALTRVDPSSFANDPLNWIAARPTPGALPVAVDLPQITQPPVGGAFLVGTPHTLSVKIEGTGAFRYQWRRNGSDLPGATNASLAILSAQVVHSGSYRVVVLGAFSSVTSDAAWVLVDADSDADGMADAWERTHGSDMFNSADASLDSDGDGVSNLNEYLAGTDPLNASSVPRIDTFSAGPPASLSFQIAPYRNYTLQYLDLLTAGDWKTLASVAAQKSHTSVEVEDRASASSSARYYRLLISP